MLNRREFNTLLACAVFGGGLPVAQAGQDIEKLHYPTAPFGDLRLLHFSDCHAQLEPVYFREPHINLGLGSTKNRAPHLVGNALLHRFDVPPQSPLAHAYTHLGFQEAAAQYGKVGGFAHLSTLVNRLRDARGEDKTLLLDGGDTWQGSATALWTRGSDMVQACNLLGVDIMTGHWEFTYPEDVLKANLRAFNGTFLAHNVSLTEEALFDDVEAFEENTGHAFAPYSIKTLNGHRVAVIGQAFPYTPIAHPKRFVPHWTFGIRETALQSLVARIRLQEKPALVVLLSHNGMDVDLKLASRVSGLDVILGGHTHDAVPQPVLVKNPEGQTLVTNAGSNGKFLASLDIAIGRRGIADFRYHLHPIFANALPADANMQAHIDAVQAPHIKQLQQPLAQTDELLYRRGNFNGTFDQILCDAQRIQGDAEIALSPGFRWGTTVLPGHPITSAQLMAQTAITYPETTVRTLSGAQLKQILEDVCDNLFNPDPYYQQGGDMVRVGGMDYVCEPRAAMGKRISELTLDNGKRVEANKKYKVASWASVSTAATGPAIWDVATEYLTDQGVVKIPKLNTPKLRGLDGNLGFAS